MIFLFVFALVTLSINTSLWWYYHQKSNHLTTGYQIELNNADTYITELQRRSEHHRKANAELLRRCEHYRRAAVTEALAAQTKTLPVIRVYPVQRRSMKWLIESHLN